MSNFDEIIGKIEDVPEAIRMRALSKCYALILSLPDPRDKKASQATTNPDSEATSSPADISTANTTDVE